MLTPYTVPHAHSDSHLCGKRGSVNCITENNTHILRALTLLCVQAKGVLAGIDDILELFSEELRY